MFVSDLAQHVGGEKVVFVSQEADGGDGRALLEAAGLPAVVAPRALPQVDAEDLPRAASVVKHRSLRQPRHNR